MSRPRIELPAFFSFTTELPVRITDINYGGHLGNDKVLAIVHEARARYLASLGLTELAIGDGTGLIMADAAIEFRAEAHYGDHIRVSLSVMNVGRAGFDMVYLLESLRAGAMVKVAIVRTGMVCYNYPGKKVVSIPQGFRVALGDPS
jgi:acyl-CoA thioester hydrolase